jgi:hypothetical protein
VQLSYLYTRKETKRQDTRSSVKRRASCRNRQREPQTCRWSNKQRQATRVTAVTNLSLATRVKRSRKGGRNRRRDENNDSLLATPPASPLLRPSPSSIEEKRQRGIGRPLKNALENKRANNACNAPTTDNPVCRSTADYRPLSPLGRPPVFKPHRASRFFHYSAATDLLYVCTAPLVFYLPERHLLSHPPTNTSSYLLYTTHVLR